MKISNRKIVAAAFSIFVMVCVLFPADFHHLKQISFFVVIVAGMKKLLRGFPQRKYQFVYFMGIIFPVCTIVQSILRGSTPGGAVSGGYTAILFLLLVIIREYDINYEKLIIFALKIIAFATVFIVLLDVVHIIDVNADTAIRRFMYGYGIGLMGKSPAYSTYYKVFIKTSPLLLILLNYCIDNKKKVMTFITIVAMFLSGTRANLFVMLVFLVFKIFTLNSDKLQGKLGKVFLIFAILIGGVAGIEIIINILYKIMNTTGSIDSDTVRMGQIKGMLEVFDDPVRIIFGAGYGNNILFDYGRNTYVTDFELAYFSLFAKIGLFWFGIFMIFLCVPFFKKIKMDYKVMYLGYLAIAFTNPLLYSSTAFLLYIYMYNMIFENKVRGECKWKIKQN